MLFEVTRLVVNVYTAKGNSYQHHSESRVSPVLPPSPWCHVIYGAALESRGAKGVSQAALRGDGEACPGPRPHPCGLASFLFSSLESSLGTSLVVQWPRLCMPSTGGLGSDPWSGN